MVGRGPGKALLPSHAPPPPQGGEGEEEEARGSSLVRHAGLDPASIATLHHGPRIKCGVTTNKKGGAFHGEEGRMGFWLNSGKGFVHRRLSDFRFSKGSG